MLSAKRQAELVTVDLGEALRGSILIAEGKLEAICGSVSLFS